MYKYILYPAVNVSLIFAQYFDYYAIILIGRRFLVDTCHRPLKIRTDGSHARVRELGSIGLLGCLLYSC